MTLKEAKELTPQQLLDEVTKLTPPGHPHWVYWMALFIKMKEKGMIESY